MTFKECIDFFRKCSNDNERYTRDERCAFLQGIAAIEKQRSKAPDYEGDGYDEDGNLIYDNAKCPNCGNDDFEYDINNWGCAYCPDCGQALDWSEVE